MERWPNCPCYLKQKSLANNISNPQNGASSGSEGTWAPQQGTSPKGKVSYLWQAGKYPNRFMAPGKENAQGWMSVLTTFQMISSVNWVPQGDLVVCRTQQPRRAAEWVQLQLHQCPSLESFLGIKTQTHGVSIAQPRHTVPPKTQEHRYLTSHTPVPLPLTNDPVPTLQHWVHNQFSKLWLLVILSSTFSVIDQKAKQAAWK